MGTGDPGFPEERFQENNGICLLCFPEMSSIPPEQKDILGDVLLLCFEPKDFPMEDPSGTFTDLSLFQVLETGHFLSHTYVYRATIQFSPDLS